MGRSSLAAVVPVLSAMGHQCCPLPVALYSSHTGGFDPVEKLDAGGFAAAALDAWQAQEIGFDCVYTGYLGGPEQVETARRAMNCCGAALRVTDPAMADGGKLYRGITSEMTQAMAELCAEADLITPNITEAVLLAGWEYREKYTAEELEQLCALLSDRYGAQVIVTGAPVEDGRILCAGHGAASWERFTLTCSYVNASYPGTGDLFCAVTTGCRVRRNWRCGLSKMPPVPPIPPERSRGSAFCLSRCWANCCPRERIADGNAEYCFDRAPDSPEYR